MSSTALLSTSKQYLSQPSPAPLISNVTSPSLILDQNNQDNFSLHSQITNQEPLLSFSANATMSSLQQPQESLISTAPSQYDYSSQPIANPSSYPSYSINGISSYNNSQYSYDPNTLIQSQWSPYANVSINQDQTQSWNVSQQSQFNDQLQSQSPLVNSSVQMSSLSQPLSSQNYYVSSQNQTLSSYSNESLLTSLLDGSQFPLTSQSNSNLQTNPQTNISPLNQYQENTQSTILTDQGHYHYSLVNQTSQAYDQNMLSYVQVNNLHESQVHPNYSNSSWPYNEQQDYKYA